MTPDPYGYDDMVPEPTNNDLPPTPPHPDDLGGFAELVPLEETP